MVWVKPSDVESLNQCARRVWYEYNVPEGAGDAANNPFDALVILMGNEHEQNVKNILSKSVRVIEAESVEHTQMLMAEKVPIIYQPQLANTSEEFIGYPDFLILQADGRYQAADAKLARKVDKEISIQLGFYRKLLNNDLSALAYLGTGEIVEVGDEANANVNSYITEIRSVLSDIDVPLVRYSESKCKACSFYTLCKSDFEAKEELTLVYGIDKRSVVGLENAGIQTISDLAKADPNKIPDVPYLKGHEKKQKAVLQAKAWKTGQMYKIKDVNIPSGTWVHFDIEANPLTKNCEDHVYLWGFLKPQYNKGSFEHIWTDSQADDENGWAAFIRKVEEYREEWPDIKLAHYSGYERTKIKEYSERYNNQGHPTVEWLLDENTGPLFDLQKPIKDSLILPVSGYGLKAICKHKDLVNFQWEDNDSGSQWSVVQYINFLQEKDLSSKELIKQSILTYNRDDVFATRRLEVWLRQQ